MRIVASGLAMQTGYRLSLEQKFLSLAFNLKEFLASYISYNEDIRRSKQCRLHDEHILIVLLAKRIKIRQLC